MPPVSDPITGPLGHRQIHERSDGAAAGGCGEHAVGRSGSDSGPRVMREGAFGFLRTMIRYAVRPCDFTSRSGATRDVLHRRRAQRVRAGPRGAPALARVRPHHGKGGDGKVRRPSTMRAAFHSIGRSKTRLRAAPRERTTNRYSRRKRAVANEDPGDRQRYSASFYTQ
jgi:hypothetical protein